MLLSLAQLHQHPIAGCMAQGIVDLFKEVKINQVQDRKPFARPLPATYRSIFS